MEELANKLNSKSRAKAISIIKFRKKLISLIAYLEILSERDREIRQEVKILKNNRLITNLNITVEDTQRCVVDYYRVPINRLKEPTFLLCNYFINFDCTEEEFTSSDLYNLLELKTIIIVIKDYVIPSNEVSMNTVWNQK